jgi:type IX secretion system PorP/SprF family membrane protein
MKKALFVLGIFIAICLHSKAQQMPLYSQYVENGFLLNPAMAGSRIYSPLRLTLRQQWAGVDGAPETQALSFNKNLGNKCTTCNAMGNPLSRKNRQNGVGLGAYLFNDSYGAVTRTGIELSYAYHLRLTRKRFGKAGTKLSFGLGGLFYQYKFDKSDIPINDPKYGPDEVSYIPDANFGVYLYNDDYFVGFSAAHLFESSVRLGDNNIDDDLMKRHYYFMAGYTFHLRDLIDLEPSAIVRKTMESDIYYDVSAKLYINHFWMSASYRSNKQIVGMIGVSYNNYYIGYAYDHYSDNYIADSSNGTHEITLGINFNIPNKMKRASKMRERRAANRNFGRNKTQRYKRQSKNYIFF